MLRSKHVLAALLALPLAFACLRASADLPAWLSEAVASSPAEAVLYRAMQLPGVSVLFPRPPAESVDQLTRLIAAGDAKAELYSLRARQNEAALRFPEAEADWKTFAVQLPDKPAGLQALADFYGRRIQPRPQFDTLLTLGDLPAAPSDRLLTPGEQPGWKAFEAALIVANQQLLDPAAVDGLWQRWTARYPDQPSVPARAVEWQVAHDRIPQAEATIAACRQRLPNDQTLPLRATALIALRPVNGATDVAGVNRALAVYDTAFRPDWPDTLVKSYMDLLAATHNQRRFTADARARLERDPDDLNAAARLFFYQQQTGQTQAALAVLEDFRASRESRLAAPAGKPAKPWSADDLHTLAALAVRAGGYPEAARFDFALASLPGALPEGQTAHAAGLAGLAEALLAAPEQPIALGSGNLSLYRDIGQLDQGPGLWNGVLSLWLNGAQIPTEFDSEETKAGPYFHRAKAAALVALLDRDAPTAPQRPALHAKLVAVYADYGDDAAVLREGQSYLQTFAQGVDRTAVALQMAGAFERTKKPAQEFALYDGLLGELAAKTDHLPLTTAALQMQRTQASPAAEASSAADAAQDAGAADAHTVAEDDPAFTNAAQNSAAALDQPKALASNAFSLNAGTPQPPANPAAAEYAQVLDRYLGRLTAEKKLPEALAVLRRELDRNPGDPALYEKLSGFLEANNLSGQNEDIYKRAIGRFGGTGWYDKLARFYLRQKRSSDLATLTKRVVDTFAGTDLAQYFSRMPTIVSPGREGGAMAVELNLYAHKRFPHDACFTENLLRLYSAEGTANPRAREQLLRENWWQTPALTAQFFEFLSSSGALDAEMAKLGPAPADDASGNPAAAEERAQAQLWRSQYEEAAPAVTALAAVYPADATLGTTAADLNRSLAWYDPAGQPGVPTAHTAAAVAVEERLLQATPADTALLEKIGDTLADHATGDPASLAASAQIWRREPGLAPGDPEHYLNAATVFWDYFQYQDAEAILAEGRRRLNQPSLYAWQMGALAEGRRDDAAAVREYVRAVVDPAPGELDQSSESSLRLQQLAGRPATAKLVDAATLEAVNASNSGSPKLHLSLATTSQTDADSNASTKADAALSAALQLRVRVLQTQNRQPESGPLLLTAAKSAQTLDSAAAIASFAQAQNQTPAREAALVREAELAQDPVERLELRYELARSRADRKDTAGAAAIIDAIDRENPNLLGVVRRTVDFDFSHDRKPAAVKRLLVAATVSHSPQPTLAKQFTAEASAKANASGDTAEARRIALTLLADDPYNAQYLSLAADSYARAGDSAGLRQFYLDRLKTVQTAQMTTIDRRDRTALLRRGYIPALTQAKDYPGAVDQYTALLSAFPEDAALNNEAALYALRYGRQPQWLAFLTKTTADSPLDARFFVDLAQSQQVFGDGAAAIDAYAKATSIRKDRTDLYEARASLEESLGRFDDAAADLARLYTLSYKDPQYMVAVARVRARQGRTADVVASLKTAYLSGPKPVPHDYFTVAAQLEAWNLLDDAGRFAVQGRSAAGADFMTGGDVSGTTVDLAAEETDTDTAAGPQNDDDIATYARILTRLGRTAEVLATLRKGAADAASLGPNSPAIVTAQASEQGPGAVTDADWRKARVAARVAAASGAYTRGLAAMGAAIHRYATPEGRTAYAAALTAEKARATPVEVRARWIDAAHAAGLAALEADWRRQVLLTADVGTANAQVEPLIALERRREAFAELGAALEAGLKAHPKLGGNAAAAATEAYRSAGDNAAELRAFRLVRFEEGAQGALRDRYLDLLLKADPTALAPLAGNRSEPLADAAANRTLADAPDGRKPSLELVRSVLRRRGASRDPAWRGSYLALAGLYLGDTSEATGDAFHDVLHPEQTIGDRLTTKATAGTRLIGADWFYNAARYGQWQLLTPASRAAAEDLLAAGLESTESEAKTDDWQALAITYAEAGDTAAALTEIDHELEASALPEAQTFDIKATLLWNAERHPEAIAVWRAAFDALRKQEDAGAPPERFWSDFAQLAARTHERALYTDLKPAMDAVLRPYLHRNGTYRSNELLHAAFDAAPDAAEGTAWILSLTAEAKDQALVLADLDHATWLPGASQVALLQRELRIAGLQGYTPAAITSKLILLDLREGRNAEAQTLLDGLAPADRHTDDLQRAEAVLAGRLGTVPALLARYTADPEHAPAKKTVAAAAGLLSREHNPQAARALLEWSFSNALAAHDLVATDYLSLAEARIAAGDTPGAVALLRSLTQSGTDADNNLDSAAAVLEANHLPAEALPFLSTLARNVPWNGRARVRLALAAAASHASGTDPAALLQALRHDPAAPYALRAEAAADLGRLHSATATNLPGPARLMLADWQAPARTPQTRRAPTRPSAPRPAGPPVYGNNSAELDLLASGQVTPDAARQPFFVAARREAATHTADAATAVTLLAEAVAIDPDAPQQAALRLDLLRAQLRAGRFAPALATAKLIAPNTGYYAPAYHPTASYDDSDGSDNATDTLNTPGGEATNRHTPENADLSDEDPQLATEEEQSLPAAALALPREARAALARDLAKVYAESDDRTTARDDLQLSLRLEPKGPHAAEDKASIYALERQTLVDAANRARRPVIGKGLTQGNVVRTRLTAPPEFAPATDPTAAAGTEVQ